MEILSCTLGTLDPPYTLHPLLRLRWGDGAYCTPILASPSGASMRTDFVISRISLDTPALMRIVPPGFTAATPSARVL